MRKTEEELAAVVAFRIVGGGTSRAGHSSTLAISHMIAKKERGKHISQPKHPHEKWASGACCPHVFPQHFF